MVHTPVVPDGEIIRILPSMANLDVMIFRNQRREPIESSLAFFFGQPIDVLHMVADRKDRFPACHRIRAYNRVCGR
jgi:uncharacterized ParB-like nuclease family protein